MTASVARMIRTAPATFSPAVAIAARCLSTESQSPSTPAKLSAAQNAFVARSGLAFSSPDTLLQALTHKTFEHGKVPTNERLEFLGQQALGLYVTEFVHSKYPNIPADTLRDAVTAYTSNASLSLLGKSLGVQDVMRWKAIDAKKSNESYVVAKVTKALIGAIYHDKGAVAARKFIHASLLSKDLDMAALLDLKEPKRLLSALLKRQGKERPVSRMLHETGRHSAAPVFVVGVFSGTRKLGEGAGSSIKMAEHRAAKDVLMKHFLAEVSKPLLPSETEGLPEEEALSFSGSKLGDSAPIV
ncbi:ribonuclease III domain-containing protein [Catenaria anguillulae PL171]|uniref:Large ribosomal subunit protein mL44 n=1 Tax=Catenaria anguillulae PL171 TaxID=765915 RepID=A0A1Y2HIP4_9FUNG|nr:ribonuclease III domain-containing protein [Catenaria anguillulae PL171]